MGRRQNQKLKRSLAQKHVSSKQNKLFDKIFIVFPHKRVLIVILASVVVIASFSVWYEYSANKAREPTITQVSNLPSNIGDFFRISSSIAETNGKIPFLYVGSEACPFCAAESWAVYEALISFGGTWSGLLYVYSNSSGEYANTPGVSFAGASYSDSSIVFDGYETSNRNWKPLQSLSGTDSAVYGKYDPNSTIPFMMIGGVYLHIGMSYSPGLLANLTPAKVQASIGDSNSPLGMSIQKEAGVIDNILNTLSNYSKDSSNYDSMLKTGNFSSLSQIMTCQALTDEVRLSH